MEQLNLGLTGLKQLPSSFGLQTKLEKLHLEHTHIEHLPESIKELTKLRHIELHGCKELHTLPELPPSLETLDASDCVSLENVIFPSTAIEQLQEKKEKVTFWNCLKLNQHSLEAIGLNARINMMNFAYRHISTFDHEHEAGGMYLYPGSKVPEWLEYSTTTHDYITIDLSSTPYFPQLAFIFCFIIPAIPSKGLVMNFKINGEGDIDVHLDTPHHGIKSDHVYLMYDQTCSHYLASRAKDHPTIQIMVKVASQYMSVQLRGFGVSLVYHSQFQKFIQQLELADGIPNNRCPLQEQL